MITTMSPPPSPLSHHDLNHAGLMITPIPRPLAHWWRRRVRGCRWSPGRWRAWPGGTTGSGGTAGSGHRGRSTRACPPPPPTAPPTAPHDARRARVSSVGAKRVCEPRWPFCEWPSCPDERRPLIGSQQLTSTIGPCKPGTEPPERQIYRSLGSHNVSGNCILHHLMMDLCSIGCLMLVHPPAAAASPYQPPRASTWPPPPTGRNWSTQRRARPNISRTRIGMVGP
jgi:hypothetical protein